MNGADQLQTVADGLAALRDRLPDRLIELAYHAAVPVAVDPGFVHLLRLNFFDPAGGDGSAPGDRLDYDDEAEFLLSPVCRAYGDDLYEIEPHLRNVLLLGLAERFGAQRVVRVARLLLGYTARHRQWQANPPFKHAQELTAWLITDPEAAQAAFSAAADTTEPNRLPNEWYLAMRTRIDRRVDHAGGFQVAIDWARSALAGDAGSGAGGVAATNLLGELARLPGAHPDRVVAVLETVSDGAAGEAARRTLRRLRPDAASGRPDPDAPDTTLGAAAALLDIASLRLPVADRRRLSAALTPTDRSGTLTADAEVILVDVADAEAAPAGHVTDEQLRRAVDRLAHLSSAPSDRAVHRALARSGGSLEKQFDLCEESAAAERGRRSYVIVVVAPARQSGRYRASISVQRGVDRPRVFATAQDRDPSGLAGMIEAAVEATLETPADDAGLSIEFVLPDELLPRPVDRWVSGLAVRHPVVVRSLAHATGASLQVRRVYRDRWRQLVREGHLRDVAVPMPAGPVLEPRVWALRTPFALWSREPVEPALLSQVVELYGPARLPDAVLELRRQSRASPDLDHLGRHLSLLWDDPFRPLGALTADHTGDPG
ncbi:hypothetical protein Drose_23130 [Dactylosporangium roseum]|uniref:vWA-MoxR associated protein C-terminal domain-containing protein n=1 Tax=Dactylosporangium roseum TaxID=47989 RepID=A0ABY5YXN9_9ACTN|nr:hypothetical protein [Dactylosporangium roseum]UWZ34141.1 hypothetical protein Drose_23130 [Dactylosporangium roseum]